MEIGLERRTLLIYAMALFHNRMIVLHRRDGYGVIKLAKIGLDEIKLKRKVALFYIAYIYN